MIMKTAPEAINGLIVDDVKDEVIEYIIAQVDHDQDGKISLSEFIKMMVGNHD